LSEKEKKLFKFLNGGKCKLPELEDASLEQLKNLFHVVKYSCANKAEHLDQAALSAHKTALEKLTVSRLKYFDILSLQLNYFFRL